MELRYIPRSVLFCALWWSAPLLAHADAYKLLDFGVGTFPLDINRSGQITGYRHFPFASEGFFWEPGSGITLISDLPGGEVNAVGEAINSAGTIVGSSITAAGRRALRWTGGNPVDLGDLTPSGGHSLALDVNDAGVIVGGRYDSTGDRPVIWTPGQPIRALPLPNGFVSGYAASINSAGLIVGAGRDAANRSHALFWDTMGNVSVLDGVIPTPGDAAARAINDAGYIVGDMFVGNELRSVYWDPFRTPHPLSAPGTGFSHGVDVNNQNQVLAHINGIYHVWDLDQPLAPSRVLLDTSSTGYSIGMLYAISDNGQIVGEGFLTDDPSGRGILLTPVPEPSSIVCVAVGAVFSLRRRRRRP